MGKNLYVGGLSFDTTEEELKTAFSEAGSVESVSIIMDRMTNPPRSRGFGFVVMATDEEAQAAIEMWNGKELNGRTLKVNEARPREDRPRGGGYGGGGNRGGGFREDRPRGGGYGGGRQYNN